MLKKFIIICCFICVKSHAQKKQIEIIEEKKASRISFYALNKTYTDYDVKITISGNNIRQSTAPPRFIRVPSASKVFLKNIFTTRGKTAVYNYKLVVNDSLSKRAIKRPPVSKIELPPQKIQPKKAITIYISPQCENCNDIVNKLNEANYAFKEYAIKDNIELRQQLIKILAKSDAELDTIKESIINLGGRIYTWIENYEQLLEELDKN